MGFLTRSIVITLLSAAAIGRAAVPSLDRPLVAPGPGARIDSLLERYRAYGYSGAVLVEHRGRLVLHHAYGPADRERDIANAIHTRFAIASITKGFTAAALLRLAERSALRTSDSLGRFFPGLPAATAGITLDQMLTHASGLPVEAGDQGLDTRTAEATAASLRRVSLRFAPGTDHLYSNFAFNVLARIVERVSGQPFERFVRDSLAARAGLRYTGLPAASGSQEGTIARGYAGSVEDLGATAPPPSDERLGSGSLVSTAADLYRWLIALREGRVVAPADWERMTADTTGVTACGWTRGRTGWGTRIVASGGDWDGYQADVYWFPEDSVVVTLTTNVTPNAFKWDATVVRGIMRVLRGRELAMPPPVVRVDSTALAPFVGRYRLDSGAFFDVSRKGRGLFVGASGQAAVSQLAWPGKAPPAAVETCSAAADSFLDALTSGDTAFVTRACETPGIAESARTWWVEHVATTGGAVRRRTLLGTAPKGSRFETFVQVETGRAEPLVVRLVWRAGTLRLTGIGSGIARPATTLFLPEGKGPLPAAGRSFAAYDPPTDQVVRIAFERDARGAVSGLSVLTTAGGQPVAARREP